MILELDEELDKAINELLHSGVYHSRHEVVREALFFLKSRVETRSDRLERLRREIAIGIGQIARGEVHDVDEVFRHLLEGLPESEPNG